MDQVDTVRTEKKKRKKHKRVSPLLVVLITLVVLVGLYFFTNSSIFDVKTLTATGSSYYAEDEIITMSNVKIGDNIFWGKSVREVKNRLLKDPYIEKIKIERKLPDKINFKITERKQIMSIAYGDSFVVMDDKGIMLRKTGTEPHLTDVYGLTIKKMELGQEVEVEETVLLRQIKELITAMYENDMYFIKIRVSKAVVNAYVLDNLICQGSPQDLVHEIETGNIQKSISKLFDENIERGTLKVSGDGYISFTPDIE